MSEDKIREMAKLLTSGATMLAESCPKCGSPLFKLTDGRIVCPNCGFSPTGAEAKKEITPPPVGELSAIAREKIHMLLKKLKEAEEPKEIKEIAEVIKLLLELMR